MIQNKNNLEFLYLALLIYKHYYFLLLRLSNSLHIVAKIKMQFFHKIIILKVEINLSK